MPDFIPRPNSAFQGWERNFIAYANANLAALGLAPADLAEILTAQAGFETALAADGAAEAAAQAARQARRDQRAALQRLLRQLVRRLQASSAVSAAERQALGITVRDAIATPSPIPTTRPVLRLGLGQLQRITVHYRDESTPTRKARPAGARAILLQRGDGVAQPASDADWRFLALDSATPHVLSFDSAEAGATIWLRGCWINSQNQQGPWSMAVSARVPG